MGREEQPRGFRDLIAWQKADGLASSTYRACKDLPAGHRWLEDQVLRAALSVPANIAEGHGRGTLAEFLRFIDISRGSLSELEYYIHFMANEGLLTQASADLLDTKRAETGRVIFGLWRSLKATAKEDWDHTGNMIREEAGLYVAG